MLYSYHWLKELSGTKKTAEQLRKLLMFHAFEVESIEKYAHGLEAIVIGEVVGLKPHPNANRLRIASVLVDRGHAKTIVCGAPNVALGQKVAVALPGTALPGGLTIEAREVRGVLSQGMLCSERELSLGENHDGILVLPDDAPVGAVFARHYGFEDVLLDIKILPDRGSDALSHEGMAREIAALEGLTPAFAEKPKKSPKVPAYNRAPKVVIQDKKGCLRYAGAYLAGVEVGPSPLWLQARLLVCGLRPINNIVDATNYLMLLSGQPMHAFDADKIHGGITVRRAKKNEKLALLNGAAVKLTPDDLVVADLKGTLALAGVMGGQASAVTEKTKNIFVEIAVFDAASVRKTKTAHNLPTDASYRFERGLDLNLPEHALRLAAELLPAITKGKLLGMRDQASKKAAPWKIRLNQELVEAVLGTEVPLFETVRLLALLGLKVRKLSAQAVVEVTVPTRRPDLRDEWTLIEEIGRMRGYEKIVPVAPVLPLSLPPRNAAKERERRLKEALAASGFDELMTYSFYGEKDARAARLPLERHAKLENPMNPEQQYLRFSLLPNLFRKTKENLRHTDGFSIFEYGSVFRNQKHGHGVKEFKDVALLHLVPAKRAARPFFELKGNVVALLQTLGLPDAVFVPVSPEYSQTAAALVHPTRAAAILIAGKPVGLIGELHPAVAKAFGIPAARIAVAGLALAHLEAHTKPVVEYAATQRFPAVLRDLTLWFPGSVAAAQIEAVLAEAGGALLQQAELFDIYEKDDAKSLSFHLAFAHAERTLASSEADRALQQMVVLAQERLGGELRQ